MIIEERQRQSGNYSGFRERRPSWWVVVGVFAAMVVITGAFHKQTFTGLSDRRSQDIAQIARSITRGDGFTTRFIRPFNVPFMEMESNGFPELNQAPLYPYAMALVFGLRQPSDQAAAWTSIAFLLTTFIATWLLGSIMFDWRTGLLAAAVVGLSAPVLRAGTSGQEWTMASTWLTLLLCVMGLHFKNKDKAASIVVYPALSAIFTALLYWTSYTFAFLALPTLAYYCITGAKRGRNAGILAVAVFVLVYIAAVSPILIRNHELTGSMIFGINAWDIMARTRVHPADTLYRSADAGNLELMRVLLFPVEHFSAFSEKLFKGISDTSLAIAVLLGPVALAFAVAGAFYKFKMPAANAIRSVTYAILPLGIISIALFRTNSQEAVIFAPVLAVYSSAYFLLLIRARKVHPVYSKLLVAGLLVITASSLLTSILWNAGGSTMDATKMTDRFFVQAAVTGAKGLIYTDVPWTAAWRTECIAVWLPRTDADISKMTAKGLRMRIVILTPESDNLSIDEAWYMLHKVKLWREYVHDPEKGLRGISETGVRTNPDIDLKTALARLKRNFTVSESITGMTPQPADPLGPDYIQVFSVP